MGASPASRRLDGNGRPGGAGASNNAGDFLASRPVGAPSRGGRGSGAVGPARASQPFLVASSLATIAARSEDERTCPCCTQPSSTEFIQTRICAPLLYGK